MGDFGKSPSQEPERISELLYRAAANRPENGITFSKDGLDDATFISYGELLRDALFNAERLKRLGLVAEGKHVLVYFSDHQSNLVWFWSVAIAGGIPMPIPQLSNDLSTRKTEIDHLTTTLDSPTLLTSETLAKLWHDAQQLVVAAVETIASDQSAQGLGRTGKAQINLKGLSNSIPSGTDDEPTATILLTSGSTGHSKLVQYTASQLLAGCKLKAARHGMNSEDVFLSWVSLDHSAALCEVHLQAIHLAANQVFVPATSFASQPDKFWGTLSQYRVGYTFAPPSFVAAAARKFDAYPPYIKSSLKYDFSPLKVIMCGGEACRTMNMKLADNILTSYGASPCSIKSAYGLSETCSALSYNLKTPKYDEHYDYPFCSVGKLLDQHEFRIVDEKGSLVGVNQQGLLHLRGPTVFKGYYNNPEANQACWTSDGWFDTGDLALLDENNNLRILGRTKEIIVLNAQKYSPTSLEHAVESTLTSGLTIGYTAAFSTWLEAGDTEELVILFNPSTDDVVDTPDLRETIGNIKSAVLNFCRTTPLVIPLPKAKMPKSTIGKLSRAKLKASMDAGEFNEFMLEQSYGEAKHGSMTDLTTPLQKAIGEILSSLTGISLSQLTLDTAIADLGLNSMKFVSFQSALASGPGAKAKRSLTLPEILGCRTIRDIALMMMVRSQDEATYEPIVPLSQAGSKTPLILCPAGGGEFLHWLRLVPLLPDRSLYALRARGFNQGEVPFETMDEMVEVYLGAIKTVQPNGPYLLLGLCFGGLLAYELAKRLESQGDKVIFAGGISNPAHLHRIAPPPARWNTFIDRLFNLDLIDAETTERWRKDLAHIEDDEELITTVMDRLPPGTFEHLSIPRDNASRWARIGSKAHAIVTGYKAEGAVTKYDVFWTPPSKTMGCSDTDWRYEWLATWKGHVIDATQHDVESEDSNGPLRFHRVAGQQYTMLKPEYVEDFAKTLSNAIEARESEGEMKYSA